MSRPVLKSLTVSFLTESNNIKGGVCLLFHLGTQHRLITSSNSNYCSKALLNSHYYTDTFLLSCEYNAGGDTVLRYFPEHKTPHCRHSLNILRILNSSGAAH